MGCSAVLAWNSPFATSRSRTLVFATFSLNYVLNFLWSALFFGKRRPDLALYEVGFFWLSIVLLMVVVQPLSTVAVWLLSPYLAWVSFASVLNQRIVALNAPFRS
jgi:benzodiazapine receptor